MLAVDGFNIQFLKNFTTLNTILRSRNKNSPLPAICGKFKIIIGNRPPLCYITKYITSIYNS